MTRARLPVWEAPSNSLTGHSMLISDVLFLTSVRNSLCASGGASSWWAVRHQANGYLCAVGVWRVSPVTHATPTEPSQNYAETGTNGSSLVIFWSLDVLPHIFRAAAWTA